MRVEGGKEMLSISLPVRLACSQIRSHQHSSLTILFLFWSPSVCGSPSPMLLWHLTVMLWKIAGRLFCRRTSSLFLVISFCWWAGETPTSRKPPFSVHQSGRHTASAHLHLGRPGVSFDRLMEVMSISSSTTKVYSILCGQRVSWRKSLWR